MTIVRVVGRGRREWTVRCLAAPSECAAASWRAVSCDVDRRLEGEVAGDVYSTIRWCRDGKRNAERCSGPEQVRSLFSYAKVDHLPTEPWQGYECQR